MEARTRTSEGYRNTIATNKQPVDWDTWLPEYISPLPPWVSREDCKYLHEQGVFNVPDARIRNELLRNYIQYVHPALPVLNLEDFFMVIDQSYAGTRGISFLLFQAVMFAATAFEKPASLTREGFRDRREARRTRFERVKLLYSLGCEDDRLTILQSVLLMTYWDDTSDHNQDAWYYVGVAKAVWKSIEMKPRDSEISLSKHQPGLWKRIQWSCYIRDRLIAITMRRPLQIPESDFDSSMLKLSDFDVGPLSTTCCLGSDGSHPAIRDPSTRRMLAEISIALTQCCRRISRVLKCQYTTTRKKNESTDTPSRHLIPRHPSATSPELLLRDSELEEWHNSLPEALRWSISDPLHHIERHSDVILHFRALLSGIYNITSSVLHRPQLVSMLPSLPELTELSKRRVHHAAIQITEIYSYFRSHGLEYLVPDGQVAMLESAIITHLEALASTKSSARQSAVRHFQLCAQALQHLGDTYVSAEVALAFVDAAVQGRTVQNRRQSLPFIDPVSQGSLGLHSTPTSPSSVVSSSDSPLGPIGWQQLNDLEPSQVSKLLCSHFMVTASEKNLLEGLVLCESDDTDSYSDDYFCTSGSSPETTTLVHSQTSAGQSLDPPADGTIDPSTTQLVGPHGFLTLNLDPTSLSSLSYFPGGGSIFESDVREEECDWELFQTFSKNCIE